MDKRIKIVFVVYAINFGGAERVMSIFANELQKRNFDVCIIAYIRTQNEYEISREIPVVYLEDFQIEKSSKVRQIINRWKTMRKIVKKFHADIIVPFIHDQTRDAFFSTRFMGVKFVSTIRINPKVSPKKKMKRLLRNVIALLSSLILVQTETQKKYFPRIIRNKIVVIPNPVDIKMLLVEKVSHGNTIVISNCGRITEQKNQLLLIQAVEKLHMRCKNIILEIYGTGNLEKNLKDYILEHKMDGYAFLKGRTNEMEKVYAKTDIFVLSSNYEGFPNALLEAMAAGCAVISTNCDTGPCDIIEQNVDGILIPVGDVDAMKSSIEYLANNKNEAKKIGQAAKLKVLHNYTTDIVIDKLSFTFSELIMSNCISNVMSYK